MTGTALRWELRKLAAQRRLRLGLLAALLAPLVVQLFFTATGSLPKDTLFGRQLTDTGLALPLFLLGFVSTWAAPVLAAAVAGDVVSSEDRLGTWPTVLTRGTGRGALLAAKLLAAALWCVAVLAALAVGSVVAGLLVEGDAALLDLGGAGLGAGTAVPLALLAWASVLLPTLAWAAVAVLVSVATRSSVAGVLAPVVLAGVTQLVALLGLRPVDLLLLAGPATAWHALLTTPRAATPVLEGAVTSAAWAAVAVTASWLLLRRRDETGTP